MKNSLILLVVLINISLASAQSKIFKGNSSSYSNLIATYYNGKIYRGNSTSYSNVVGTISDGKIYRGNSISYSNLIGSFEGGFMTGAAGAAYLLLL